MASPVPICILWMARLNNIVYFEESSRRQLNWAENALLCCTIAPFENVLQLAH